MSELLLCGMLTRFTHFLPHVFSAGTPTPAGPWVGVVVVEDKAVQTERIRRKVEVLWMEKVLVAVED